MTFPWACLNTGTDFHLLDHIAPLANLFQIPLITTEEQNYLLANHYYPQVSSLYEPDLEFKLGSLAERYDVLFECKYWAPHLKLLFQQLYKKEIRLVFCPHGQSDKGYRAPLLAPYTQQDAILLYGDLMVEMLQELDIPISSFAFVGNYRYLHYLKYKNFYDEIAEKEVFSKLKKNRPTLIYAPTWQDADQSTSFFRINSQFLQQIPNDWNFIIKLHPLLEQRNPSQFYPLLSSLKNTILLTEFPPVYPILSRCDAYLGDMSSVGYDFLKFQKPLFFLSPQIKGRLLHCGFTVDNPSQIFQKIEKNFLFQKKQAALYHSAFRELSLDEIKMNVMKMLIQY